MSLVDAVLSTLGIETVSLTYGDPKAEWLLRELAAGRWQPVAEFFRDLRDWDERDFYVRTLTKWPGRPEWIEEWTAAEPDSANAWLLRAVHTVQWAWEARGAGYAETVGEKAFTVFFKRLREADAEFQRAIDLDPKDSTPWAHWMWAGIGAQIGLDGIRQRHDEAVRRHAHQYTARHAMLQALCAKWYGSADQMFAYARHVYGNLPDGHGLHVLLPMAHVERRMQYERDKEFKAAARYFQRAEVVDEVTDAAERSILSPQYQPTALVMEERNWFAHVFCEMGQMTEARRQFRQIGPWVASPPWGMRDEATREFMTARRNSGGPLVRIGATTLVFHGLNVLGVVVPLVALASVVGVWTAMGRPATGPLNAVFGFLVAGIDWSYRKSFLGGSMLDENGGRLLHIPLWCWGLLWLVVGLVQTVAGMIG